VLDISIEQGEINIEALDAELRAALDEVSLGVSTANEQVIVHLSDEATPEQQEQARAIVLEHDPKQLTPRQQSFVQRQQKLVQLREANATSLDLSVYDGETALLSQLAQKVAWLETELLVSRGD